MSSPLSSVSPSSERTMRTPSPRTSPRPSDTTTTAGSSPSKPKPTPMSISLDAIENEPRYAGHTDFRTSMMPYPKKQDAFGKPDVFITCNGSPLQVIFPAAINVHDSKLAPYFSLSTYNFAETLDSKHKALTGLKAIFSFTCPPKTTPESVRAANMYQTTVMALMGMFKTVEKRDPHAKPTPFWREDHESDSFTVPGSTEPILRNLPGSRLVDTIPDLDMSLFCDAHSDKEDDGDDVGSSKDASTAFDLSPSKMRKRMAEQQGKAAAAASTSMESKKERTLQSLDDPQGLWHQIFSRHPLTKLTGFSSPDIRRSNGKIVHPADYQDFVKSLNSGLVGVVGELIVWNIAQNARGSGSRTYQLLVRQIRELPTPSSLTPWVQSIAAGHQSESVSPASAKDSGSKRRAPNGEPPETPSPSAKKKRATRSRAAQEDQVRRRGANQEDVKGKAKATDGDMEGVET